MVLCYCAYKIWLFVMFLFIQFMYFLVDQHMFREFRINATCNRDVSGSILSAFGFSQSKNPQILCNAFAISWSALAFDEIKDIT